jgi:hypothetical protein
MSRIEKHFFLWRAGILVLLVVAIVGPWTFSSDGLPPPKWCSGANRLVVGDRCIRLVSNAEILAFNYVVSIEFVTTGLGSANVLREMGRMVPLFVLESILITPFFSTLLIFLREESRRRRVFHAAVLGIGVIASLLIVKMLSLLPRLPELSGKLWGGWLYALTAGTALFVEVIVLVKKNPSSAN